MNSQQLLYINLILGGLFIAYFFFGRTSPKAPTRLNLKNKNESPKSESPKSEVEIKIEIEKKTDHRITSSKDSMIILEPENNEGSKNKTEKSAQKELAVFFIYNGHDWEAHHVLGIPQGASLKFITDSYQALLSHTDPKSFDFLEAAYKSLLQSKRNRDRL